jgi:hypothetical protein
VSPSANSTFQAAFGLLSLQLGKHNLVPGLHCVRSPCDMDPLIDATVDLLAPQGCKVAALPNQLSSATSLVESSRNTAACHRIAQSDEEDCRRGAARIQLVCLQETAAVNMFSPARDAARGRGHQVSLGLQLQASKRMLFLPTLQCSLASSSSTRGQRASRPAASLILSSDMPRRQQLRPGSRS